MNLTRTNTIVLFIIQSAAVLFAPSAAVRAQNTTIFSESFNSSGATPPLGPYPLGPPLLQQAGWIFRNQCQPIGTINWLDSWSFSGPSASDYDGSFLRTHSWNIAPSSTGTQSMWAVLPNVAALSAGDTLRFRLRTFGPNQHLEVRLSPSGGTSTGSAPTDIGDFTILISDLVVPNNLWNLVTVDVPSNGRLGLRHYATQAGQTGSNAGGVWIDAMEITEPSGPTIVTWTAAASPHVIMGTQLIDANTVLNIEAGATVHLNPSATLRIEGHVNALGTEVNPVIFTGTAPYPDAPRVVIAAGGLLELDHVDVQCWIEPMVGDIFGTVLAGDLTARHSRFHGPGQIYTNGHAAGQPSVLVIEDCAFESQSAFWHQACQARLRNLTFVTPGTFPGDAAVLWGHMNVDNLTSDGVKLWFGDNRYGGQAQYLNNLSVTNLPQSAGLLLDSRNYLLGSNVNITNSDVPVEFGDSGATGLLPGSHVPPTGNINNIVLDSDREFPTAVMGAIWAPLAVPYVIPGGALRGTGDLDILPGARIVLGQDVRWEWFGFFNAEGTPDQPIVFENFSPEFRWNAMVTKTQLARLDNCEIRGGDSGILTVGGFARVSNMLFEDCFNGLLVIDDGTFWEVGKSRFRNNFSALTGTMFADGGTTPNSIAGNTRGAWASAALGVNPMRARGNWWGSANGPTIASNPGGTGDLIESTNVLYQPFATVEPDFNNTPPTVRIVDTHHRIFEPGSKVIIHWSAMDDGSITEQRVLFSPTDFVGTHQLIATLPPGQRSFEWTVPSVGINNDTIETFRVEAVDNAGQVGWDEQVCAIAEDESSGDLDITTVFQPQHEFGDMFATTWTHGAWPVADLPSVYGRIMFENDFTWQDLGGNHAGAGILSGNQFIGNVSTDFARLHLRTNRSQFQVRHFFGDSFAIRPDTRMGDAPPTITLNSPSNGTAYSGGSTVPLAWTAADDEGVRSFDIIASYDGGRLWYPVVRDLPATATSYNWTLPPSTGIPNVRVRVIVRDLRFQNSSDVAAIVLTPGSVLPLGDIDGDVDVDFVDLDLFVAVLLGNDSSPLHQSRSDVNADGTANGQDVGPFVAALIGP